MKSTRTWCVCVYIYIYIYTYIHTHMYIHTKMLWDHREHVHRCWCLYMNSEISKNMIYIHTYIYIIHMNIYIYIYIYIYVYICTYILRCYETIKNLYIVVDVYTWTASVMKGMYMCYMFVYHQRVSRRVCICVIRLHIK